MYRIHIQFLQVVLIFEFFIYFYFLFFIYLIYFSRSIESDYVKTTIIHKFHRSRYFGLLPLVNFKSLI